MALGYTLTATTFAALCGIVWLLLGGTFLQAVAVYLVSGQVLLLSLFGLALLRAPQSDEADRQR